MCDGRVWCGGKADFIAADESAPVWAGYDFSIGLPAQPVAGVCIIGRRDGERLYAEYVGEADDITRALATDISDVPEGGPIHWMPQFSALARTYIVRAIVDRYHPPGNRLSPVARRPSGADGALRLH